MKFIVCVKQVPDTTEVHIDPKTHTLIREGVPAILNPFDQFALEECIKCRKLVEGEVIVLTMGPPQAESALKQCLAIGADRGVLITDRAFAGADTYTTSYTLAKAINLVGEYDLIFCGQQAMDGDTAQVGPELAQQLHIPQITYVEEVCEIGKKVLARRETDRGYELIESSIPALLACLPPTSFEPKAPRFSEIIKAKKKPIARWGLKELGGSEKVYGLKGSPTQVIRTYAPPKRGKCIMLEEEPTTAAKKLAKFLQRK